MRLARLPPHCPLSNEVKLQRFFLLRDLTHRPAQTQPQLKSLSLFYPPPSNIPSFPSAIPLGAKKLLIPNLVINSFEHVPVFFFFFFFFSSQSSFLTLMSSSRSIAEINDIVSRCYRPWELCH